MATCVVSGTAGDGMITSTTLTLGKNKMTPWQSLSTTFMSVAPVMELLCSVQETPASDPFYFVDFNISLLC